jgi:hypothetical protein
MSLIDGHDIQDIKQALDAAVDDLSRRVKAVAESDKVIEYAAEDRACLLSSFQVKYAENCDSDNGQKVLARADPEYQKSLELQKAEFQKAKEHIHANRVAYTRFEQARSLLSMAKLELPATFSQLGRQP